jgi:hypothetical protein
MKDPFVKPALMKDPFVMSALMKDPFINTERAPHAEEWARAHNTRSAACHPVDLA